MQDWLNILVRSFALFFGVLVIVRIMGKRHPSRMAPFFHVVYTFIAITAALIATNIITNVVFGFIALGSWAVLMLLIDYAALKSKMAHDLVNGRETVLIKQGKIMEENLSQVRLTGEELLRELRAKNVFNLADVEFALMETTGEINVLLKSDKTPVTPHHLERRVAPQSEPQTVIYDGNILDEPLAALGLNARWVRTELEKTGVALENVFIGQADSDGELYLDLFDDAIQLPQSKVKELLYAALEKSQAELVSYAYETQNEQAKAMYQKNAGRLKRVLENLRPYLLR
ncbi:MAG: DUF421 domain-containing protein [Firmicutes bacterium]|nr:DUF421 domain-containing protein [Bacillota bacterium]